MQRLRTLPVPLKIVAYAAAAAAVLVVAAGVGVVAALTPAVLGVVLLLGVAALAVAIGTLRSSRRSEGLGESRYELPRDHQERLELLGEERRTPSEELERESQ